MTWRRKLKRKNKIKPHATPRELQWYVPRCSYCGLVLFVMEKMN